MLHIKKKLTYQIKALIGPSLCLSSCSWSSSGSSSWLRDRRSTRSSWNKRKWRFGSKGSSKGSRDTRHRFQVWPHTHRNPNSCCVFAVQTSFNYSKCNLEMQKFGRRVTVKLCCVLQARLCPTGWCLEEVIPKQWPLDTLELRMACVSIALLFPKSKCCFSATLNLKYGVVVTLHYSLRLQTRPHSLKGQHQRSQVLQRPVIAEGTREDARRMHTHTHAHAQHSCLNHNVKM